MAVRNSNALKLRRAETIYAILCILTFFSFHRHCVESQAKLLFHVLAISAVVAGMLMLKNERKEFIQIIRELFSLCVHRHNRCRLKNFDVLLSPESEKAQKRLAEC